jgi:type III secretory pathway lipoprotein EscJ
MSKTEHRKVYRPMLLVLALAIACGLLSACSKQKIQNVADESEANRIVDILGESGIRATKQEAGEGERRYFEIEVDGGDEITSAAIQVINDHCLAQSPPETPEGSGVVTSSQVEKEREARRRKLSIESQLRDIPGTTCVKVNFVMPEDSSIAIDRYPSTASALVTYKTASFPLSKDRVAEMVAKGVPALKAENVQVELIQKPVRPLPDYRAGYNFARVAIISLLGFLTVLLTISIVFVLQKRRNPAAVNDLGSIDQDPLNEAPLLPSEDLDDRGRVA